MHQFGKGCVSCIIAYFVTILDSC